MKHLLELKGCMTGRCKLPVSNFSRNIPQVQISLMATQIKSLTQSLKLVLLQYVQPKLPQKIEDYVIYQSHCKSIIF